MLRSSLFALLLVSSFAVLPSSAAEKAEERYQKELIAAMESVFDCKAQVKVMTIPKNSRLRVNKNGEEALNESLKGFDQLVVIMLSGKGMGENPRLAGGPDGVQIRLIAKNTSPNPPSGSTLTQTFSASYTQPSDATSGVTLVEGFDSVFKRTDRKREAGDSILGNLTIELIPEAVEKK